MKTVLHVLTTGRSCDLLRGQPAFMRARGVEIRIAAGKSPLMEAFGRRERVVTYNIPMTRAITPLRDLAALWRLWRLMKDIRPDVVHNHTPKACLLGALAGRLAGIPVAHHVHGLPHLARRGLEGWLLRQSERVACRLAHRVLCVSPSIRRVLVEDGFCNHAKVRVPNAGSGTGIDAEGQFHPDRLAPGARAATRARYGIPDGALVVGFCGRVVRDKGIVELAAAWAELRESHPNLHLLIAGPPEQGDRVPPETFAALGRDARVTLAGAVEEMPALYAAMDILALPTYREGFGNVLAEANAMRLPVVATRIPGCVDAVADGRTAILVAPRDARALARAINTYARDPQLRKLHGRNGRERVLGLFRPADVLSAIHGVYQEILAERARKEAAAGGWQGAAKRSLDMAVSASLLAVAVPLMAAIALAIRATLREPAIFGQVRPGYREAPFTIYKFRTMLTAAADDGSPLPDAERLTPLGRLLRKTSLDELPQLWNVLRGEMSLVGPRPLLPGYIPRYTETQRQRHLVRPGITGWAQIHGRQDMPFSRRIDLDIWYVRHHNFLLDLKVLAKTALLVACAAGVRFGQDPAEVDDLGPPKRIADESYPVNHSAAQTGAL
jgi:lipopolysaccharide/colanic/teichoic acid biosynthesis glycosyltransferase/glycosyltransferase involved in cell wall biosynthesis